MFFQTNPLYKTFIKTESVVVPRLSYVVQAVFRQTVAFFDIYLLSSWWLLWHCGR